MTIAELLYKELNDAYCDSCRYCSEIKEEELPCEWCHRKDIKWEISKSYSVYLADKIKDLLVHN